MEFYQGIKNVRDEKYSFTLNVFLFLFITFAGFAQEGLIPHYTFNKGAGTEAGDVSCSNNPSICYNMDENSWIDGVAGTTPAFDGVDDYVKIADFLSDPLGEDFTAAIQTAAPVTG